MKHILSSVLAVLVLSSHAQAQSDGLFGLDDSLMACLFMEEAQEIAAIDPKWRRPCDPNTTRSVIEFDEIGLLRDAYRTDPDATLDLIERILKAGGNG